MAAPAVACGDDSIARLRLHTADEDLSEELIALREAGARRPAVESSPRSGKVLAGLVVDAQAGDVLVVTTLERLASRTAALTRTLLHLVERGITLEVLDRPELDTAAPESVGLLRALEDASRGEQSRATREGMRRSGKRPGRPVVMTPEKIEMAIELRRFDRSIAHIARVLGVSPSAVQRALSD